MSISVYSPHSGVDIYENLQGISISQNAPNANFLFITLPLEPEKPSTFSTSKLHPLYVFRC